MADNNHTTFHFLLSHQTPGWHSYFQGRLLRRLKESINKGGEKVSPVELDNVINQYEKIQEAVSFAIEDGHHGQDVGCAVKPADCQELYTQELKKWVSERLSNFKVPEQIWISNDIPKTAIGNVQRKMVAEAMEKKRYNLSQSPREMQVPSLLPQ